ncbi:4Fe-4S binding protein [Geoalkalibacter halelectricus]|uniref:4Fe-4S binding protein n=1 Tax=Geoalkalibacter halelectricus TaxID=2847045 RepID=A0ABY5ZJC2_9BACT|nr:4Fe-4S binding protein [Geoalkalibacter halelectricus]MDO3379796.1 4Fe-4S binding protein [Geoalkalibacter halelectricus]UWZ79230.1 4Fe-4S binding protein [Geoalkalibacter halelectricus]
MIREIVTIDEEKCDGCGLCVPACAEGAIQIVDGKARLIADNLCDGLGACLGDCPRDAIKIIQREADAFDEEAVDEHLKKSGKPPLTAHAPESQVKPQAHGGCPSARLMEFSRKSEPQTTDEEAGERPSELRQWPIQMNLVPPTAPFFKDADLVLAADCAPFAFPEFHRDILKGKALAIGCPKLDDGKAYLEKLTAILRHNDIRSLTVVHMEVPCCTGLIMLARQAVADSGKDVPIETVKVGIQGDLKS